VLVVVNMHRDKLSQSRSPKFRTTYFSKILARTSKRMDFLSLGNHESADILVVEYDSIDV
jgi:hypothetical protein